MVIFIDMELTEGIYFMSILIDAVRINGFRGLSNLEIHLPRVCVLLGTNNSGKTSIIKALQLALGDYSRYLTLDSPLNPLIRTASINILIK
jgi:predicted ATP-dependent endonuclease of OLD family